jgi:hypothetical protein
LNAIDFLKPQVQSLFVVKILVDFLKALEFNLTIQETLAALQPESVFLTSPARVLHCDGTIRTFV